MINLRQLAQTRIARNGFLYTLTVQAPFTNPHKSLPDKDTFIRQFADIAHNHADHVEHLEDLRIAEEQVAEYLRENAAASTEPGQSF